MNFSVDLLFPESPNGLSAIECLYIYDTYGRKEPCRELQKMKEVLNGKSGLNFQIQQWSEGIVEGLFVKIEFMESYPWLPQWVWNSLTNEVFKRRKQNNAKS